MERSLASPSLMPSSQINVALSPSYVRLRGYDFSGEVHANLSVSKEAEAPPIAR